MIEEVVPPLAHRRIAPPVVETSISDHDRPVPLPPNTPGASQPPRKLRTSKKSLVAIADLLPDSTLAELRWVAEQEGRDITEIVVTAIDEFLADHWVRDSDL